MANAVTNSGMHVEINSISSAYTYSAFVPIRAIQFNPGAASDECTIRSTDNSGAVIFYAKCTDAKDQRIKYFNGTYARPHFDPTSGCTFTGASILLTLGYQK
jgi:hypothetical protein